jgi:hypothetical protein
MCKETGEIVYITKNGEGDLVVMDIGAFTRRESMLKLRENLVAVEEESTLIILLTADKITDGFSNPMGRFNKYSLRLMKKYILSKQVNDYGTGNIVRIAQTGQLEFNALPARAWMLAVQQWERDGRKVLAGALAGRCAKNSPD